MVTCPISAKRKRRTYFMTSTSKPIHLEDRIRDIPDFPQKGVLFKDITPLLQDPAAFREAMDRLAAHYKDAGIEAVRSEEHTSGLQSHFNLVCRLLLEKKKYQQTWTIPVSVSDHGHSNVSPRDLISVFYRL